MMTSLLKNDLEQIKQQMIRQASGYVPSVTIDSFRSAAAGCTWFMIENDLLTDYLGLGPEHGEGFYSTNHHVEALNSAISQYNSGRDLDSLERYYGYWNGVYGYHILKYLEKVIDSTKQLTR